MQDVAGRKAGRKRRWESQEPRLGGNGKGERLKDEKILRGEEQGELRPWEALGHAHRGQGNAELKEFTSQVP